MARYGLYRCLSLCCLVWLLVVPVFASEIAEPLAVDVTDMNSELTFSFYGKTLRVDKLKPVKVQSMGKSDIADAWNGYKTMEVDKVLSSLIS